MQVNNGHKAMLLEVKGYEVKGQGERPGVAGKQKWPNKPTHCVFLRITIVPFIFTT